MNVFDASIKDQTIYSDPYSIYQEILRSTPILWSELLQAWIVLGYQEIIDYADSENVTVTRQSVQLEDLPVETAQKYHDFFGQWMMYLDPPLHTEYRNAGRTLVSNINTQNILLKLDAYIDSLLSTLTKKEKFNLVYDYSEKIGIFAITSLFGLEEFQTEISVLSKTIINFMQGRYLSQEDILKKTNTSIEQLNQLLEDNLQTVVHGLNLDTKQIISIVGNIILDTPEPIASGITNGIIGLMKETELLQEIRMFGASSKNIDYLLQKDPPFQYIVRHALRDFHIDNCLIKKKDRLLFMIGAANQEVLAINKKHLTFGYGKHLCLGARFAKEVIQLAISKIYKVYSELIIFPDTIIRYPTLGSRTIKSALVQGKRAD